MVSAEAIEALKAAVWGEVLLPGDKHWDTATWMFDYNPQIEGEPAFAVRVKGALDVVEGLKFAREHGLEVGVRSGGHSPAAHSRPVGGLVIDMSLMRGVHVDPTSKTAIVEGGALLTDIDRETAVHGLACTLGHASTTGMGLVLNGGIGLLGRAYGPSCDAVLSAQIITAGGSVLHVDKESDPELHWGLRGAGSTLGVVTRVVMQLVDVSHMAAGHMVWAADAQHTQFRTIARFMHEHIHDTRWAMNLAYGLMPDGSAACISQICIYDAERSAEEKLAFLAPIRALGPMVDDVRVGDRAYLNMQTCLLPMLRSLPNPRYGRWGTGLAAAGRSFDAFLDAFICAAIEGLPLDKAPFTLAVIDMWGGAYKLSPSPIGFKAADFMWALLAAWQGNEHTADVLAYVQSVKDALAPHGIGGKYANFATELELPAGGEDDSDGGDPLAARVGGAANVARLRALKARLDPGNVFHRNPFGSRERKEA